MQLRIEEDFGDEGEKELFLTEIFEVYLVPEFMLRSRYGRLSDNPIQVAKRQGKNYLNNTRSRYNV